MEEITGKKENTAQLSETAQTLFTLGMRKGRDTKEGIGSPELGIKYLGFAAISAKNQGKLSSEKQR